MTSSLSFPFRRDGREEGLTLSEILALSHEADRDLRRRATRRSSRSWSGTGWS